MKKRFCLIVVLCGYLFNVFAQNNNILDVDFMQSMTDDNLEAAKFLVSDSVHSDYFRILQNDYESKKPSKMPYNALPLIPKVMHHIWDGDIPPLYQNYLNECKKLHPDWEFKIWGDKEVADLGLIYQDLYNKMRGYVIKADVLRYEILYRFGGVYRDMDVKCYKPIDDLNHMYEFYASLDGPFTYKYPIINIGLVASKPQNEIFKKTLDMINKDIDQKLMVWDNDKLCTKDVSPHEFAFKHTLEPFTDVFVQNIDPDNKSLAFPASYFMPILNRDFAFKKSNSLEFLEYRSKVYFSAFKPDSLMWHNAFKGEIRSGDFKYTNGTDTYPGIKILKSLKPLHKKMYHTYEHLYYSGSMPDKVNWSKNSKTPQTIHFVVLDDSELSILEKNLPTWKMLNGDFEIIIWNKEKLIETFKELGDFKQNDLLDNFRFYAGLKLIGKFGGTYADFRAIPHSPIFELNNKYNFYAGLMILSNKESSNFLSQKLVGAGKNNPIISIVLSQVNLDNLDQVNELFSLEVYKNIYLYGKNIVLPAMYLEPLGNLGEDSFVDKVMRFIKKKPKPFAELTEYVVVE
jgi:hypothetical protein